MGKITVITCDVKPCRLPAEREFEFNGEKMYVCGESCFVKFWAREYTTWKLSPYVLHATLAGQQPSEASTAALPRENSPVTSATLQLVKF